MIVYVMGREIGPVKIGVSRNPDKRIVEIQSGCPYPIEILYWVRARDRPNAFELERDFHEVFRDKRLTGEWFSMNADDASDGLEMCFDTEQHFFEKYGSKNKRRVP